MSTKVYLVTGANRGIGLALVKELSQIPNSTVLATARNPDNATDLAELSNASANVKVLKLDVSSDESIATVPSQLEALGIDSIDYFLNNAGMAQTVIYQPVIKVPASVYLEHYKTNVLGPLTLTQTLMPYLSKGEAKTIAYTSSLFGSIAAGSGNPGSAYCNTKAALNQLSKQLSVELGPQGFTIVAIHPGAVLTDMLQPIFAHATEDVAAQIKSVSVTPEVSAQKQVKLIQGLTKEDNGKFLRFDNGAEIPW